LYAFSTGSALSLSSHPHHHALPSFPTRRSSDLVTSRATAIAVSRLPSTSVGRSASKAGDVRTASGARPVTRVRAREYKEVDDPRSEEHTSELQSRFDLVCRLLLEKKNIQRTVNEHPNQSVRTSAKSPKGEGVDLLIQTPSEPRTPIIFYNRP